jgi:multidrug efflux pump subunit AcrB
LNIDRGMNPRDATVQAMTEVSGPVAAIAFILGAVFVPVAFSAASAVRFIGSLPSLSRRRSCCPHSRPCPSARP